MERSAGTVTSLLYCSCDLRVFGAGGSVSGSSQCNAAVRNVHVRQRRVLRSARPAISFCLREILVLSVLRAVELVSWRLAIQSVVGATSSTSGSDPRTAGPCVRAASRRTVGHSIFQVCDCSDPRPPRRQSTSEGYWRPRVLLVPFVCCVGSGPGNRFALVEGLFHIYLSP